jgi:hypothetical protein
VESWLRDENYKNVLLTFGWLIREIVTVCFENHRQHLNTACGLILSYHRLVTAVSYRVESRQAISLGPKIRKVKAPDFLDFRHNEGGKVVTLTHRPSLPPGVFLVLIFMGGVDPRTHGSVCSFGKKPSDWESVPRPSD